MDFLLAQAFQFLFDYEVEELPAGLWVAQSLFCILEKWNTFLSLLQPMWILQLKYEHPGI